MCAGIVICIRFDLRVPGRVPLGRRIAAGPVVHPSAALLAGDRPHAHDTAVAVALARMTLTEPGHALRQRAPQRIADRPRPVVHAVVHHTHAGTLVRGLHRRDARRAVGVRGRTEAAGRVVLVLPEHARGKAAGRAARTVVARAARIRGRRHQSARGQRGHGHQAGKHRACRPRPMRATRERFMTPPGRRPIMTKTHKGLLPVLINRTGLSRPSRNPSHRPDSTTPTRVPRETTPISQEKHREKRTWK